MNVLVIAAHPDDEVLGVGGTIARHSAEGDNVVILILSEGCSAQYGDGVMDVPVMVERKTAAARKAAKILGAEVKIEPFPDMKFHTIPQVDINHGVEIMVNLHKPDIVYTHSYHDINTDHQIAHRATLIACRWLAPIQIYAYEVLSSTERYGGFAPSHYVDITDYLAETLGAMECYDMELRESPHTRNILDVRGLSIWRGMEAGCKHAEAFEVIKIVR